MNCDEVQALLHAYVDGEVDLVRNLQIDEHRVTCDRCERQLAGLRALREAVVQKSSYYRSSAALRAKVSSGLPRVDTGRRSFKYNSLLAAGIVLMIGLAGSALAFVYWPGFAANDRLAASILGSHVRSLQVAHLTDVLSSDRHTVKPWFVGKIDYAPEILDLSAEGYALAGGRLDYVDGHAVAALVYRKRQHVINLFLWPESNVRRNSSRTLTLQGFHLRHWQQAGMTYWAISDLNEPELDEFVRLVQEQASAR